MNNTVAITRASNSRVSITLAGGLLLILLQQPGFAAQDNNDLMMASKKSVQLEEVTVTGTRSNRPVELVSKSISIISTETIDTRLPADALHLLQELPGVSMASNGGLAGQAVLRGFSTQSFRAPLFINGDRFRGRNTLEFMLIDPNQVERIEVIRGPAASLYGTDSFAGIIHVITKRAGGDVNQPFQSTNAYLSTNYQSVNDGSGARLQWAGAGDGFDVLFGLNSKKGNDYDSPEGNIPNSDYSADAFDTRIGYTLAPHHRIEVIAKYADVERARAGGQFAAPGAGNELGAVQRQMRDEPTKEKHIALGYQGEAPQWGFEQVEASLYRRAIDSRIHVIPNLNNPTTFVDVHVSDTTLLGGRLIGVTSWSDSIITTLGLDWYDEDRPGKQQSAKGGAFSQEEPDTAQFNAGVFMLHEWDPIDPLTLSASLRYDYVRTELDTDFIVDPAVKVLFEEAGDTENKQTTGGFGMIYRAFEQIHLVGNINTSFRAPSVTELSAVGTGVDANPRIPNTDIRPEKGITYEMGLRGYFNTVDLNLIGFVGQYDDLINRNVPITYNGEAAIQMQNIGEAEISGIEFDATWRPVPQWRVAGNLNWLRGTNKTLDEPLPQIMPLNGFASVRYDTQLGSGFYVEGTTNWATERTRVDEATERERAGYMVFNLYAGLTLSSVFGQGAPPTIVRFGIENLFDKSYRLPTTPEDIKYPESKTNPLVEPGRNFKISLNVGF
ncbi:MAG: TonB-dependent receptor [Marinomonas foliarum]|uniref:TonB-dependent receptor n=1 Tax=Marinomonas foliarum TaxID=491950 RepID=UPI003F9D8CFB